MRIILATLFIVVGVGILAACGGETAAEPAAAGSDAPATSATLELRNGSGSVGVAVEIADSPAERRRGLSGRPTLAAEQGMLFVNEQDVSVGYHMKDTTIPLSLAFVSTEGAIMAIVDMEPCAAEPCPVYRPPAAYRFGLEVNQGAFERWGIVAGSRVVFAE